MLLRYREDVVRIEANAQEVIDNHRRYLSREEMVHIRERLKELSNSCRDRRLRKARMVMGESGLDQEGLNWLETTPHFEKDSLSLEGLPCGRAIEPQVVQRAANHSRENHAVIGGSGRLQGRCIDGNVVNLSRRHLLPGDVALLSKGLKFSPSPTDIDKAQLKRDIDYFKRRMRLRWFFRDREANTDSDNFRFKCKSSGNPPRGDPLLEAFLSNLEHEVLSVMPIGKNFSNLSASELAALQDLRCDRNIVIEGADKGSAVVVWDREDYLEEAN